jgi:hypothetical protein
MTEQTPMTALSISIIGEGEERVTAIEVDDDFPVPDPLFVVVFDGNNKFVLAIDDQAPDMEVGDILAQIRNLYNTIGKQAGIWSDN